MALLYQGFKEGINVGGCSELFNKNALAEYLEKKSITNYQIFDTNTRYPKTLQKLVSNKEMSIFCRQMSFVFLSDITVMEGLLLISEQCDSLQLKLSLNEIYNHMENGMTFSDAISMYTNIFNNYFINMIRIGESSGTLDSVFLKLSDFFEKENNLNKKVKSALTYPAILSIMMAAVIVLLIVKVLPMFGNILKSFGQDMPIITSWILSVSVFLSNFGLVIIASIIGLAVILVFCANTEKGKYFFDKLKVKNKIFRDLYSKVTVARFAHSLGILLKSGINIVTALKEVNSLVENKYLRIKLDKALESVEGGADLAESLKKVGIFQPLFIKMVVIGSATGRLDEMLEKTAMLFDEEVSDSLQKMTALIEPLLIIFLSVVVGIILISVMLPMINIMTNIG